MSELSEKERIAFSIKRAEEVVSYEPEQEKFCDAIVVFRKPGMFVMNLGNYLPQNNVKFHTRLWVDPIAFKSFIHVMANQLEQHEKQYGEVPSIGVDMNIFSHLTKSTPDSQE